MKHNSNRHISILIDKKKAVKKVKEQRRSSTKTFYFDDTEKDTKRVRVYDKYVGGKQYAKRLTSRRVRHAAEVADGGSYKKEHDIAFWVS